MAIPLQSWFLASQVFGILQGPCGTVVDLGYYLDGH